jgi:glycosyltransferase involved in cell wall biosynthesis
VITSGIGDLRTFIVDEESAFLCPKLDTSLFADKICRVISDPGLADKVGQAGKNQAISIMDYHRYSSVLANLFTENVCQ